MSGKVTNQTVVEETRPTALPAIGLLQRKCDCGNHTMSGACDDCAKKKRPMQRKAVHHIESSEAPGIVHDVLRSHGRPLDAATRGFMERRLGHDFSRVRVHTDEKAADSASAVNALAYTVGKDVVFGAGQYAPGTNAGRHLLAHELTHVVQQTGSIRPGQRGNESPLETEADTVATAVMSNHSRVPVHGRSAQALAAKPESYEQVRTRVLAELKRRMPVALMGMIAELDESTREQLATDPQIRTALSQLPTRARLRIERYLLYGRKVPAELMDLERAAEEKNVEKVEAGLERLREKREARLNTIDVGNIKEKVEYEFRGTTAEKEIHKRAESLEFDWNEMLAFARKSKTLRDLEASVKRRHPGLRASKGTARGGTQSNAPMGYLNIEPNVSLKGAVVRYAHELQNLWMDQDYDRIKERASSGGYASASVCAKELVDIELSAVIIREKVASELGFTYSPEAAKVVKPPPATMSQKDQEKYREKAHSELKKAYEKPVTEGGKGILPGYERMCRGWMALAQDQPQPTNGGD